MCDIVIKPIFDVKPPEFDEYIRVYQEADSSGFWIKQTEINKTIGYCRGAVSCEVNEEFIIKLHDEYGKLMNFVSLTLCTDYIMDLPTVGKKREKARKLIAFFRNLKQKLFAINGIDAVKSECETREVTIEPIVRQPMAQKTDEKDIVIERLNSIIERQKKEIELMTKKFEMIHCAFLDYKSTFENFLKEA